MSKIGKKRGKSGKREENREKIKKKRKNREEKAKIGKILSLCPSLQIWLATLLHMRKLYKHSHERFLGNRSLTCARCYIRSFNAISYLRTDHPTVYRVSEVLNSTHLVMGFPKKRCLLRVFVWTHKMVNS